MTDCKSVFTPSASGTQLQKATDSEYEQVRKSGFPYHEVIGSLIYLMTTTRPDISWTVFKLSQHFDKPAHVMAVKHLLRYFSGTVTHGITYRPTSSILGGFADSDWAGDVGDRCSTTGFIVTLGSAPINWRSTKQSTLALSSCEAEYVTLSEATKEMIYLLSLCSSLDIK